ncbi:hypothetical protein CPAV1605_982 [seawater metagenome]|uniref:Uncharacterized protein n=1 Tax=seawater metagenome TaxID=1561972 RepID=A0A5E8CJN8_9ZZZZ
MIARNDNTMITEVINEIGETCLMTETGMLLPKRVKFRKQYKEQSIDSSDNINASKNANISYEEIEALRPIKGLGSKLVNFRPVPRELREKNQMKIASLAPEVL